MTRRSLDARLQGRAMCVAGLAFVLIGCAVSPEVAAPTPSKSPPFPAATEPLATTATPPDGNPARALPGGLLWEEHALTQAPSLEPLSFDPVEGTQQDVLARHAAQRERAFPDHSFFDESTPGLWAPWEGGRIEARVLTAEGDEPQQTIELAYRDWILFTTPAGLPSPALPLQGLWTHDGHWALEVLLTTPDTWAGQVFEDGELVNQGKGYDEAFGYQLLADRPFFFFQRNGVIGVEYDDQDAELGYTLVPHYRCCSESALNPVQAEEMVAFFAVRDGVWYFVELGAFEMD
jgi:hypothetical protein